MVEVWVGLVVGLGWVGRLVMERFGTAGELMVLSCWEWRVVRKVKYGVD